MTSVFEVGGKSITDADVAARLKITGDYSAAALALARDAAAATAADDLGISISDQELQGAYDDFRRSAGLNKAEDTQSWLDGMGLTVEDVESWLESGLLRGKIGNQLVSDEQVESHYAQNPKAYEFARVSQIVVTDKNAADELAISIKEDNEDFASLARSHSIDESTKCGGGFCGLVTRDDALGLPDDIADRVFSAAAGEIIGPFESDGTCYIVRVEENGRLPLDDDLREGIRCDLCEAMLAEKSGV